MCRAHYCAKQTLNLFGGFHGKIEKKDLDIQLFYSTKYQQRYLEKTGSLGLNVVFMDNRKPL